MLIGVLCALGAGLLWGLVFVVPLMLGDYPGMVLSFGRYVAFGLIALLPAWLDRKRMRALSRADWRRALKLALIGNLLYYAMLASAIQMAGSPLPTMLIGTLPVAIAVFSNWSPGHPSESVAWSRLAPSLLIILTGLLLVNASELDAFRQAGGQRSLADYVVGCLLAAGGVAAWTWYPVMNARHLKANPHIHSVTWATAQGLVTLPLALLGLFGYGAYASIGQTGFDFPLGPQPLRFVGLMLLVGLTASWLGTLLWNQASQRLPTSLAGQLIVFETLFALLYAFILRGALPGAAIAGGIVLLCAGVLLGVRAFRHQLH
ncbi:DMT family transporter [Janthinobacterium fluminis]|uniref:DMT family transporter n=1 Tax=Janthinobacterium fluminis TaxID=2987524 RepID=A0ABT5JYV2_9BURK|nr:DMT family transporter [Janthinobacterium fluminis]MDC8757769.1 DMT family transporter [Janthinobacterium fluminis]